MSVVIYPYPTLVGNIKLLFPQVEVQRVQDGNIIRDILLEDVVDRERNTIDVSHHEDKEWPLLLLKLRVEGPQRELIALDKAGTQIGLTVVAKSGLTNIRQAVKLTRSGADPSIWSGDLHLDRRQFTGEVRVRAVITGTVSGRPHRFLGSSNEITIYMDPASAPFLNGALLVTWADFRTRDDLKAYANEPFYLNLDSAKPEVLLNSAVDEMPRLFPKQGGPGGALQAVHETMRMSIAKSVWMALFQTALAAITTAEGEEGDPSWPEVSWQRDILKKILPRVYPDADADGVEILIRAEAARRSEAARFLEAGALAVIGRDVLRDGTALRRAVRVLDTLEKEA